MANSGKMTKEETEETQILEDLKKSPLFNLSLASKELFHSNFLYWLSITQKDQFLQFMQDLYGQKIMEKCPNSWIAKREYNHFDLCIINEKPSDKDNKYLLILENKVKSIPYKEQLNKYANKVTCEHKILLSLVHTFPDMKNITGWKVIHYDTLSEKLKDWNDNYFQWEDNYHKRLVEDYIYYIEKLDRLCSIWEDKDSILLNHLYQSEQDEEKARINDLFEKNKASLLSEELHSILAKEKCPVNEERTLEIKKILKDWDKKKNAPIFVGFDFFRTKGLFEAKIRVTDNMFWLITVQGDNYRHSVEYIKKYPNCDLNFAIPNVSEKDDISKFLEFKDFNSTTSDVKVPNFAKEKFPLLPKKKKKNKMTGDLECPSYHIFGKIQYKFIEIDESTTKDAVIKAMATDVEEICRKWKISKSE